MPHPLDLVALILGILFTLRQMDVAGRQPDRYPGVAAADFERWKRSALFAYRLGSSACFGKVLFDIGASYLMANVALPTALRWGIGLGSDLTWAALVAYSYYRVTKARALGREVGAETRPPAREGPPEA